MSLRSPASRRVSACLVAVVGLAALSSNPAEAAQRPSSTTQQVARAAAAEYHGYLVKTLPDLDTAAEDYDPGSVILAPGPKTVRVGKSLNPGLVVLFKDGEKATYGIQQRIKRKWYTMASLTKTNPSDGCAMGGPDWPALAMVPGTFRVRGFVKQDGQLSVTPSYKVTVKPKR